MERENELEHLKKTVSGLLDRLPPNISSRFPNNSWIDTPKASQVVCSLLSTVRPAGLDASVEAIKLESHYSPFSYQEWDHLDRLDYDFTDEDHPSDPFFIDQNGNDTLYGDSSVQLIRCNLCSKVLKLSVFAEHIEWCKRHYNVPDKNEEEENRQKINKKRRKEPTEEPKSTKRTKTSGVLLSSNRLTSLKKKDQGSDNSKGTDYSGNGISHKRSKSINSKTLNPLIQLPSEPPVIKDAAQIVLTFIENLSHKKNTTQDLQRAIDALKYSQPTPLASYRPPRDGFNIFEEANIHLSHLKTLPNMDFPVLKYRRKDAVHHSHPVPIEVENISETVKPPAPAKITSPTETVPNGVVGLPNCMQTTGTIPNINQPPHRDRQPPQNIPQSQVVRVTRSRVEPLPPQPEQKPLPTPPNGTSAPAGGYPYSNIPANMRETNGSNPTNNNVRRTREIGVTPIWTNNNNRSNFHNSSNNNMF